VSSLSSASSAPLYIVAADRAAARAWAAEQGIRPKDWHLATRHAMRGLSRVRVAYVDGWRTRRDLAQIEHTLAVIRSTAGGSAVVVTTEHPAPCAPSS
jgi:hypothetical protein